MIQLITRHNFIGYWSDVVLRYGFQITKIKSTFQDFVPEGDNAVPINPDTQLIILVGYSLKQYYVKGIEKTYKQFLDNGGKIIHISYFGDRLLHENTKSYVVRDETKTLADMLIDYCSDELEPYRDDVNWVNDIDELLEGIKDYHKYILEGDGILYNRLSNHYQTKLGKEVARYASIDTFLTANEGLLDTLERNERKYIRDKLSDAQVKSVDGWLVVLIYSDLYVNEIANHFLQFEGFNGVIVLVGEKGKYRDVFQLRTSEPNAEKVATLLGGKGTDKTGYITIPTDEIIFNAVLQQVKENDITPKT